MNSLKTYHVLLVVERGQNKAEKRATTLCAAYYLQNKTTLLMGVYYVTKKRAMQLKDRQGRL